MNHEELQKCEIFQNGDFVVYYCSKSKQNELAFAANAVAPELLNVVKASTFMYQFLTLQYNELQRIVDFSEWILQKFNLDELHSDLHKTLCKMQDDILLAQIAAREGVQKASAYLDAQNKTKAK